MREPARDGRIFTFYSYKGGTGRSMLLANIAWILASNGKRVLMIDWDLEAPGLHRYFHPFLGDKYMRTTDGLMDLVYDYQKAVSALPPETKTVPPDLLAHYADTTPWIVSLDVDALALEGMGTLHLLPAGKQDDCYPERINRFDWQRLYTQQGGFDFFEAFRSGLERSYDYVLIDSRTGVSDTSGLCTLQMPDTLVICFTMNSQSIFGASAVARDVLAKRSNGTGNPDLAHSGRRYPFRGFAVPTRIERGEKAKVDAARRIAREQFKDFPTNFKGPDAERYWNRVEVPYESYYAFEEHLAVFADRHGDVNSLLAAAERITTYLTDEKISAARYLPDATRLRIRDRYLVAESSHLDLSDSAEAFVSKLPADEEDAARALLLRFVYAEHAGAANLRPVPPSEIPDSCEQAMERFVAEGLVIRRESPIGRSETLEIADSNLLSNWRRFTDWALKDRDFILWRTKLSVDSDAWEGSHGENSRLMRGNELAASVEWLKRRKDELSKREISYINASQTQEEVEEQMDAKRVSDMELKLSAAEMRFTDELHLLQAEVDKIRQARRTTVWRLKGRPISFWALLIILLVAVSAALWFAGEYLTRRPASRARAGSFSTSTGVASSIAEQSSVGSTESVEEAAKAISAGQADLDAKNYKAALDQFTLAIKTNPNSMPSYYGRALAYEGLNDYKAEINDLNNVMNTDKSNPDASYHLALAYYNRSLNEQAVAAATVAINDSVGKINPHAYALLGYAYSKLNEYQKAVNALKIATKQDPANDAAWGWLGYALDNLNAEPDAIEAYDKAINLAPKTAGYYEGRGATYNDMGRPALALKDLDYAIKLDPNVFSAWRKRGYAYRSQSNWEKAKDNFDQAIKLNPKDDYSYEARAEVEDKLNQKDAANKDRQKVVELRKTPSS